MEPIRSGGSVKDPDTGSLPPEISKRIHDLLGIQIFRLAELNRTLFMAIYGVPFVPLQGQFDSYAILRGFRKRHIDEIFEQTGWQITWPTGVGYILAEGGSKGSSWQKEGTSGFFRIAYALKARTYIGVKVTEDKKWEYEIQEALRDARQLLCATDCCRISSEGLGNRLYQFMPIAGLGSVDKLAPYIRALKDTQFQELIWWYLTTNLCMGLEQMHKRRHFHLDVQGGNLVVTHRGEVYLLDFGWTQAATRLRKSLMPSPSSLSEKGEKKFFLSKMIHAIDDFFSNKSSARVVDLPTFAPEKFEESNKGVDCFSGLHGGNHLHFAPERWMAQHQQRDPICDGEKIDGWSVGVFLLNLIKGGDDPFDRNALEYLVANTGTKRGPQVIRTHFQSKLSAIPELTDPAPNSLWSLIRGLLAVDPDDRLSPAAALSHQWVSETLERFGSQHEKVVNRLIEFVQSQTFEGLTSGSRSEQVATINRPLSPQQLPLPHFTDYVERTELQSKLTKRLLAPTLSTTILQGSGGVGKSKLALRLIHSTPIRDYFGVKLWFRGADQSNALEAQIMTIAAELGLVKGSATSEEAIKAFHRYLTDQSKPYLIVFDNAEDPELLEPYLPRGKGHLLITARTGKWPDATPVGVLSEEEAISLVSALLQVQPADSQKLAKELGYLPLAIVQASAYIRNQHLSVGDYLTLLRENESVILQADETLFGKNLPSSVGALWATTFKTLERIAPKSLALLDLVAYVAPDNIPKPFIHSLAGEEEGPIGVLVEYALLSHDGEGYSIHRLSQAVRRCWQQPQYQGNLIGEAIRVFNEVFQGRSSSRPQVQQYLPHGEMLQLRMEKYGPLPKGPDTKPLLLKFYGKMGDGEDELNLNKRVVFYYEKHIKISLELGDLKEEGRACCYLGNAHHRLGKSEKALAFQTRRLELAEKRGDRAEEGAASGSLGLLWQLFGEYSKAVKYYQKDLEIALERKDLVSASGAVCNLGNLYTFLGQSDLAIQCHTDALNFADLVGNDLMRVRALGNLGNVYYTMQNAEQAIQYQNQSLELAKAIGDLEGEGKAYSGLGNAYDVLKQYNMAITFHEKRLKVAEQLDNLPSMGIAYSNLGIAYLSLGEYRQAIFYGQKGYEVALQVGDLLGQAHSLANLGAAYSSLGDHSTAAEYLQKAYQLMLKVLGMFHPQTIQCAQSLLASLQQIQE